MIAFRDAAQCDRVLRALARACSDGKMLGYYSPRIPRINPDYLSANERHRIESAGRLQELLDILSDHREVGIQQILCMSAEAVVAIGSLLVALGNGHDDVDEWIAMYTDDKEPR